MLVDAGHTWRGAQRQLLLLAQGLRSEGLEPLVVVPPHSALLAECKRAGVATAVRRMRGTLDVLAVRGLRRLVSAWQPTVVHAHDPRSHALALAALVGRRGRIPLVVTRRLTTPPRGRLRYGGRVSRFIAITDAVANGLRAGGVPEDRIARIHPGVPAPDRATPRDWRAECGWEAERVVAGIVGPRSDGSHRKQLERLLAGIPADDRRRLAAVVLGGPSEGSVTIAGIPAYRAGFVHDVPAALAGLDLLLHPGGAEGLGTALVEGMALRVPAVAFATGGVAEILSGTPPVGVLVPDGDEAAFAAATAELLRDAPRRQRLGNNGPSRAADFDDRRMVAATLDVYQAVTAGNFQIGMGG